MILVETKELEELQKISDDSNSWGNKAAVLRRLMHYGLPVPSGIILHTSLFDKYKQIADKERLEKFKSELNYAIDTKIKGKGLKAPLIFRSSANIEGSDDLCCSGIFESHLCDYQDDYFETVERVWKSLYDKGTIDYLSEKTDMEKIKMAILIQSVCRGELCGVFQTYNVIRNTRGMLVEYSPWRLEAVVDGMDNSNWLLLSENGKIQEGSWRGNHNILERLQKLGKKIESILGGHVEVEFVIENDEIYILQARKIGRIF